jgi:hypothetical protein
MRNLILFVFFAMLALASCVQYPQDFAQAEQIRVASNATAVAADAQATRYKIETNATATVAAAMVQARLTEVPQQVRTENANDQLRLTTGSIALIVFVLIGAMALLGVAMWIRRRARTIPRDKTGQLEGFYDEKTGTYVNLQAIPAFQLPNPETGAPAKIIGLDDQEHVLAAFVPALAPTTAAALMSGGLSEREREKRIKIVREDPVRDRDGNIAIPGTTVVEGSGRAVDEICDHLGISLAPPPAPKQLPNLDYPQIEAPRQEDTRGSVSAWAEVGVGDK